MHLRFAIVLAAAIVLADADASAATESAQASDTPIKRFLRSETSVDVNGDERWGLSILNKFFEWLKSWRTSTKNDYVKLDKDAAASSKNLDEKALAPYNKIVKKVKASVKQLKMKSDDRKAYASLKEIVKEAKASIKELVWISNARDPSETLATYFKEDYAKFARKITKHNKLHSSAKVLNPMVFLRKAFADRDILKALTIMKNKKKESKADIYNDLFGAWLEKKIPADIVPGLVGKDLGSEYINWAEAKSKDVNLIQANTEEETKEVKYKLQWLKDSSTNVITTPDA